MSAYEWFDVTEMSDTELHAELDRLCEAHEINSGMVLGCLRDGLRELGAMKHRERQELGRQIDAIIDEQDRRSLLEEQLEASYPPPLFN